MLPVLKKCFDKKSVVYQGFNEVAILPKREFTLDLAKKPPLLKLFLVKSRCLDDA